jgi:hypothetical protein
MESTEMRKLMLVVALAAFPTGVFAQSTPSADMEQGLSMLELAASKTLEMYGVETDVMSLTLSQLAEIKAIADTDEDMGAGKARIEAAIAR